MSTEVGRIDLGLDINKKMFNRQLSGIAGGAEKQVKSAFGGMGLKIGKTLGLALGGAAIVSFTKSALKLGSDLTEVQNVVDVTFRQMSGSVNTFASTAIDTFGLSETLAKQYMGTFGAMSKSMGLSEKQALSMAKSITGLTGDVASFYNKSADEAYTKLKSIWTGETETLKELGIIMTQTNLDNYALNEGLGKTTKTMTEQEKLMLRYRYVMSQLSDAQGDFARNYDSWANQTRVLSLRFDQLKATIGQGLINLFTPVVKMINTVIARLQVLAEAFKRFTEMLTGNKSAGGGIGSVAADVANATSNLNDGIGDLGSEASGAAKKITKSLMGFDELNVLQDLSAGGGGGGSVGGDPQNLLQDMTSATQKSTSRLSSAFDGLIKDMKSKLSTVFSLGSERAQLTKEFLALVEDIFSVFKGDKAKQIGLDLIAIFTDSFVSLLELGLQFGNDIMRNIISSIRNNKENLKSVLKDTLSATQTVTSTIRDFLGGVFQHIRSNYDKYIKPSIDNFGEGFNNVFTRVSGAYAQHLAPTINEIAKQFSELVNEYVKPLAEEILNFGGSVTELISQLYKHISPFVGWIGGFVVVGISNALRSIWEIFEFVYKIIATRLEAFFGVLHGLTEFLNGAFSGDWDRAWKGVRKILDSWWEGSTSLFNIVKETIKDNFGDAIEGANNLIDSGLGSIKTLFSTFMERIRIILSPFKGIVEGLGDTLKTTFKGAINGVISQFNKFAGWINDRMKFSWDGLEVGGKKIFGGGSVQLAKVPTIPALANGGYVAANTPRLALVGDNKREGEIIAPESKIAEAVAAAMQLFLDALREILGDRDDAPINVYLGNEKLDSLIVSANNRRALRNGGRG